MKWTPTDWFKVTANYVHTDLNGLPDFGVPYNRARAPARRSPTSTCRATPIYGFVNRDFQKAKQDFGTVNTEIAVNRSTSRSTTSRASQRSVLDYIGTLPKQSDRTDAWTVGQPQSRYQVTDVLANQTDATFKFNYRARQARGGAGAEFSREKVRRDTYAGLTSELARRFQTATERYGVNMFNPPNLLAVQRRPAA